MMGIELELLTILVIHIVGSAYFAHFEIETPGWRKMLKWGILSGLTIGLYFVIGHLAVAIPLALVGIGTLFHFTWCRKNGIHPLKATPRKKYYELRGWEWRE